MRPPRGAAPVPALRRTGGGDGSPTTGPPAGNCRGINRTRCVRLSGEYRRFGIHPSGRAPSRLSKTPANVGNAFGGSNSIASSVHFGGVAFLDHERAGGTGPRVIRGIFN